VLESSRRMFVRTSLRSRTRIASMNRSPASPDPSRRGAALCPRRRWRFPRWEGLGVVSVYARCHAPLDCVSRFGFFVRIHRHQSLADSSRVRPRAPSPSRKEFLRWLSRERSSDANVPELIAVTNPPRTPCPLEIIPLPMLSTAKFFIDRAQGNVSLVQAQTRIIGVVRGSRRARSQRRAVVAPLSPRTTAMFTPRMNQAAAAAPLAPWCTECLAAEHFSTTSFLRSSVVGASLRY